MVKDRGGLILQLTARKHTACVSFFLNPTNQAAPSTRLFRASLSEHAGATMDAARLRFTMDAADG